MPAPAATAASFRLRRVGAACAVHSHEMPASGELQLLITGLHVVGVTTKPTIFASAMAKGDRYDGHMRDLAELGGSTETAIFTVTTDDVRG